MITLHEKKLRSELTEAHIKEVSELYGEIQRHKNGPLLLLPAAAPQSNPSSSSSSLSLCLTKELADTKDKMNKLLGQVGMLTLQVKQKENSIATLFDKKEEMKALKKITDTRRRAEEIAALRERNAKAKLEKQKREVEQQEEIAKQSKVMQKLKKYVYRMTMSLFS